MIDFIVDFIVSMFVSDAVGAGMEKKKSVIGNIIRTICWIIFIVALTLAYISFSDNGVKIF